MYETIKRDIIASLRRYADQGVPTGDFLRAALSDHLFEACVRADPENAAALVQIARYIANEMPSECWGSPAIVDAWIKRKRAERANTKAEAV